MGRGGGATLNQREGLGTAADMEGEGKGEEGGRNGELKEKKEKVWKRRASDLACKA